MAGHIIFWAIGSITDAFVVLELMPTGLELVLISRKALRPDHLKYSMQQILRAVHFKHSSRVLHRDLEPNNVLINGEFQVRSGD